MSIPAELNEIVQKYKGPLPEDLKKILQNHGEQNMAAPSKTEPKDEKENTHLTAIKAHIDKCISERVNHFPSRWHEKLNEDDVKFVCTLQFAYDRHRGVHIVPQITGAAQLAFPYTLPKLNLPESIGAIALRRERVSYKDASSQFYRENEGTHIFGNDEAYECSLARMILLHRIVNMLRVEMQKVEYNGCNNVYLDNKRTIGLYFQHDYYCRVHGEWTWEQIMEVEKAYNHVMDAFGFGSRVSYGICLGK